MSLERLEACPVCQEKSFTPFLTCKDFTTTEEVFHVEQCSSCKMTFTNPRPSEDSAGKYYQSSTYISHTSAAAGIIDYIYLIIRRFALRWKYQLIKPTLQAQKLLDFGCGTGHFVNYAASKGVISYGIEPSIEARELAQNKNVYTSINDLPNCKFHVITLWHVIEHVYNLSSTLKKLKDRLEENGTIFIAVPNWQSYDATYYKELWAAYDVPRHVWHFSKDSMTRLVETEGLKIKKIVPMKLDSYYVSLLSEKNKNRGKLTILNSMNAIIVGFKSNLLGRKSQNQSSLIYIITK